MWTIACLSLLWLLGASSNEAEREEVVGVLGSSVLLDPKITVDSGKNEILWTFKASNESQYDILDHVPGVATSEPSEQFKDRLQFNALSAALTISRLNARDQGDYTFTVDGNELKIMELLVIDKVKEEFGLLGSSVLLDPELKVDPSKSEIVWTFIGRSILHHVPGHSSVELSDQFEFRLHFNTSNGALTVNGAEHGDQGDYTFMVDGQELRIIQLHLFGFSFKDIILIAALTAGQVISAPSLRSAVLLDQWGWKTLGGYLGNTFYFLSVCICNTLSLTATYIGLIYWFVVKGLSPLDLVVICVMIVGLQLSSFYINVLWLLTKIKELLKGSKMTTIWWKLKAVCDVVLINCFIIAWIISTTISGLSTVGIVSIILSIVLPVLIVLILMSQSLVTGDSIKDALVVGLMLPLVNVMIIVYLMCKKISNKDGDRLRRWIPVYNVGFLIVVIIATISWMVFKGLRPEDVGVAVTSMVGLVFATAYAIIFTCWSRKEYPDDKQWWWCLNTCNIVALVFILTALICWIVSKDQSCKTNISLWIILTLLGVTVIITLSRSFPVCSRNEGASENNRAEIEQDLGEMQELQILRPGREVEAEKHPVS